MKRLEMAGWVAFLLGTVVFLISGIIDQNVWVIAGSFLFIVGILAILIAGRSG